jgi:hypothetical protein
VRDGDRTSLLGEFERGESHLNADGTSWGLDYSSARLCWNSTRSIMELASMITLLLVYLVTGPSFTYKLFPDVHPFSSRTPLEVSGAEWVCVDGCVWV